MKQTRLNSIFIADILHLNFNFPKIHNLQITKSLSVRLKPSMTKLDLVECNFAWDFFVLSYSEIIV